MYNVVFDECLEDMILPQNKSKALPTTKNDLASLELLMTGSHQFTSSPVTQVLWKSVSSLLLAFLWHRNQSRPTNLTMQFKTMRTYTRISVTQGLRNYWFQNVYMNLKVFFFFYLP